VGQLGRRFWWLFLPLIALGILLGLRALRPAAMENLNKTAPEISLPLLEGQGRLDLPALRGRVVLLDFFATWCPPCQKEMPVLARLAERHKDKGLQVIGIDAIDREQGGIPRVRRFVARFGLPFPIALDYREEAADAYRVEAIPTLVLIDREGMVRAVYQGAREEAELEEALLELLQERP
jgi:thiol-disulfide isomerase/thioredoxin